MMTQLQQHTKHDSLRRRAAAGHSPRRIKGKLGGPPSGQNSAKLEGLPDVERVQDHEGAVRVQAAAALDSIRKDRQRCQNAQAEAHNVPRNVRGEAQRQRPVEGLPDLNTCKMQAAAALDSVSNDRQHCQHAQAKAHNRDVRGEAQRHLQEVAQEGLLDVEQVQIDEGTVRVQAMFLACPR